MLDSIMIIHQTYQKLSIEQYLTEQEKNSLYEDVTAATTAYPFALEEYIWIERAVNLLNILGMKWGILDARNYKFRKERNTYVDSVEKMTYINMLSSFFNMETLWFAHAARQPPLNMVLPRQVIYSGLDVQRQLLNLIKFMVNLNSNVSFETYFEIHEYL